MKKLLGLLGAFVITASASTSVIACQPDGANDNVGKIDESITEINGITKDLALDSHYYETFKDKSLPEDYRLEAIEMGLSTLYWNKWNEKQEANPVDVKETIMDTVLRLEDFDFHCFAVLTWIESLNEVLSSSENWKGNEIDSSKITRFTQLFAAANKILEIENIVNDFITFMEADLIWTGNKREKTNYTQDQKNKFFGLLGSKTFTIELDTINNKEEVILYSTTIQFNGNVPVFKYLGALVLNITEKVETTL